MNWSVKDDIHMAMRWDKFTLKSQEAVQTAVSLANENGQPEVLPMHLLMALVEDKDGIIVPLLQKIGVPTEQLFASRRYRARLQSRACLRPCRRY
jgi:ATP-dependent Clp protease ATP-binding subunit ClpA